VFDWFVLTKELLQVAYIADTAKTMGDDDEGIPQHQHTRQPMRWENENVSESVRRIDRRLLSQVGPFVLFYSIQDSSS
jgi:hypothetical protein